MGLTSDSEDPRLGHGPGGDGMNEVYLVDGKADSDFVRPVRRSYQHKKCGSITTMAQEIAETYARNPGFYGATYCVGCKTHLPVGPQGEFVWINEGGNVTKQLVGT